MHLRRVTGEVKRMAVPEAPSAVAPAPGDAKQAAQAKPTDDPGLQPA